MLIRPARHGDWKQIKRLIKLFPTQLMQTHLPRIGEFFVASDKEGNLVGCCALEVYSRRIAEIRSLVVAPDWQDKGLGTALIRECIKLAKKKRILELFAITGKVKLFEKFEFYPFSSEKYAVIRIMRKA